MVKRSIPKWRPKAWDDIESHAEFVGRGDKESGEQFLDRVEETVQLLCEHPELGGIFETANPKLSGVRAKLVRGFSRYVVFYLVLGDVIEIARVLGGGQDMDEIISDEW